MTEQLFYAKKDSEYVNEEVFTGELKLGTKEGEFFYDTRFTAEKIEEIKKRLNYDIKVVRVESEDNQLKTYRKTATIQAEQFDGSDEMIKRYSIDYWRNTNDPMFRLKTLEGSMSLNVGDWIATGVKGEHWAIADDVFKTSYVEVTE